MIRKIILSFQPAQDPVLKDLVLIGWSLFKTGSFKTGSLICYLTNRGAKLSKIPLGGVLDSFGPGQHYPKHPQGVSC